MMLVIPILQSLRISPTNTSSKATAQHVPLPSCEAGYLEGCRSRLFVRPTSSLGQRVRSSRRSSARCMRMRSPNRQLDLVAPRLSQGDRSRPVVCRDTRVHTVKAGLPTDASSSGVTMQGDWKRYPSAKGTNDGADLSCTALCCDHRLNSVWRTRDLFPIISRPLLSRRILSDFVSHSQRATGKGP